MNSPISFLTERFKKPTDKQIIEFVLVINNGKIQPRKLTDMVAMSQMIIDRLYENGDILIPSLKEKVNHSSNPSQK